MAGVISTQSYVNPYQWSEQMGGKKKKKKPKTKAQKAAAARHAKFKQTKVQTFGGKRKSFSKSEESRIKKAGYSVKGYSSAAPNKASGYSGTTGVSVGSKIKNPNPKKAKPAARQTVASLPSDYKQTEAKQFAKAAAFKASQPKIKDGTKVAGNYTGSYSNRQLLPDGSHGFPKVGDVINTGGKSGKDFKYDGKSWNAVPVNTAMLPGENMGSIIGTGAALGFGLSLHGMIKNAVDFGGKLKENIERKVNPDADKISAVGNLTGLGISPAPSYFSTSPTSSYGYPSQAEVDKAAGITAGGLNIGGGGFTPSNPSGGTTSRAIRDMTSEQLADRYEASLDPNSFKGLSDGETRGVGPVASGRAYAAGLNVDNKNVENIGRSILSKIPGVNIRRLTDKEIADNRVSAQKKLAYRKEMAQFRGAGGGGGARLPVAPLTPEEILLPEETAVAPTVPDYQQAQTGVDPNRLMQIQQDAYLQAFNPSYNPMFRFFNRRGGARRGAFRRALSRN